MSPNQKCFEFDLNHPRGRERKKVRKLSKAYELRRKKKQRNEVDTEISKRKNAQRKKEIVRHEVFLDLH